VLKKASDRITVQANRRSGEPALAQQVLLEFLSNSKSWRNRSWLLGACPVPIRGNESGERMEGEGVPASTPSAQPPAIEIVNYMLGRKALVLDHAQLEPSHEVLDQPGRYLHRGRSVSLGLHLFEKHLNEG